MESTIAQTSPDRGVAFGQVSTLGIQPQTIAASIDAHERHTRPRLAMLWDYYRNPLTFVGQVRDGRAYKLGQERGLPLRITNPPATGVQQADALRQRECVIENDIAWRIGAMIDFLFGQPVRIVSTASDQTKARQIEAALEQVWESSGGLGLLQEAAVLAHVFGHVDLEVSRLDEPGETPRRASDAVRIGVLDPRQTIAVFSAGGGTEPVAMVQRVHAHPPGASPIWTTRVISALGEAHFSDSGQGPRLVASGKNRVQAGRLPIAHIVNAPQPLSWSGLGEVEPLIPLQDELNTRLSDRAYRVTLQSFKMYLVKGLGVGAQDRPVGPGLIWSTDNPDAHIEAFGGDASSPSEDAHIAQIRDALDKASGVPPLATGVVQARVGNLSSENALRLTLQGLLSRTSRKRLAYGRGIARCCELVLAALHEAGVLTTSEDERGIRLEWPEVISRESSSVVRDAQAKRELGVSNERLLTELGYAASDPGVE